MLFAYIDSATGSMLLQAMAGLFLAGMVMGRRVLAAPLEWLHLKKASPQTDSEAHEMADLSADQ